MGKYLNWLPFKSDRENFLTRLGQLFPQFLPLILVVKFELTLSDFQSIILIITSPLFLQNELLVKQFQRFENFAENILREKL